MQLLHNFLIYPTLKFDTHYDVHFLKNYLNSVFEYGILGTLCLDTCICLCYIFYYKCYCLFCMYIFSILHKVKESRRLKEWHRCGWFECLSPIYSRYAHNIEIAFKLFLRNVYVSDEFARDTFVQYNKSMISESTQRHWIYDRERNAFSYLAVLYIIYSLHLWPSVFLELNFVVFFRCFEIIHFPLFLFFTIKIYWIVICLA